MHDPSLGSSLIESQLPRYEQRILRTQVVRASAPTTFAAIRRVDFFRSPAVALPNRARIAIDTVRGRRGAHIQRSRSEFRFDQLLEPDGGFHLLAEEPGHAMVLGSSVAGGRRATAASSGRQQTSAGSPFPDMASALGVSQFSRTTPTRLS